jgi:voltage-gated potassium channel
MASSLFGIAIVALPAGIITAGYMKELEKERLEDEREEAEKQRQRDKTEPKPPKERL